MTVSRLVKQLFTYNGGANAQTTLNNNPDAGITLPSGILPVASTAGFTTSGTISVYSSTGTGLYSLQTVTYTGITSTSFTGCAGGTGVLFNYATYPSPNIITQASNSSANLFSWTAPPGVKWVWITGCGGGGGGGSGASVSSTNFAYPLFVWCLAGGGGGGQAAITSTHAVAVVPGATYPIALGYGGLGAVTNPVWNGNPYPGVALYPNNYGGACWGNPGSNGQSSIFGSFIFGGGQGGRRGEILQRAWSPSEQGAFAAGDNAVGGTQYNGARWPAGFTDFTTSAAFPNPVLGGQTVQNRTYGIWNPPGIQSSNFVLDQVITIGIINNSQSLVANAAPAGANCNWLPGSGGGGGGGGGGTSNNIYSVGGGGGFASFGNAGPNFAGGGGYGTYGGGGGGGGGGEGVYWNNTHDGAHGGDGGAGFIEIAWIQ
jgi:hypothetical protein